MKRLMVSFLVAVLAFHSRHACANDPFVLSKKRKRRGSEAVPPYFCLERWFTSGRRLPASSISIPGKFSRRTVLPSDASPGKQPGQAMC